MPGYELPQTEGLSVEEAGQVINQLNGDWAGDPSHPLLNPLHPQHEDFTAAKNQLWAIKTQDDDQRPQMERLMAEGLAEQQQRQEDRRAEAESEMEQLYELGYSADDLPETVSESLLNLLKCQRMNAQDNMTEMMPILERELVATKASAPMLQSLHTLVSDQDVDPELRQKLVEELIVWVHDKKRGQ
ncbi:hypothetical protein ACFL6U_09190 [Planctomycetota bacterium]